MTESSRRLAPGSFAMAVLLTCLVAFGPVSTDLYLASLPDMARAFRTDAATVQLTLSGFLVGFAVMQLAYGPLSDRFGRRRAILGGICVYLAGTVVCIFAPSIEILIAGRVLQAVGACCGPVVGRAVVRDVYPREAAARVMSYMASAMALAPFVAPIAGGWCHALFGWQANFVLLLVVGLGLLLAVKRLLAETNPHPDRHALSPGRLLGNYARVFRDRHFLGCVLTVAMAFGGMFTFISASSFVLIDVLGLPVQWFGLGFSVVVAGYIVGGFLAGRLTATVGFERMVTAGTLGCAGSGLLLAGLAFAGVSSLPAVLLPMMLFFLSSALVLPNCTAAAIAPFPRMAGVASAGLGFVQILWGSACGWLVANLFDGSTRPLAAVVMAMGLATLAAHRLLARPKG